jgi:hypothetical protein
MMKQRSTIYQAHRGIISVFYTVLAVWTLISVPLLIEKAPRIDTLLLIMITFVISFTWYWSLGLVYGIEITENDQTITLKSFRGKVEYKLGDLRRIEAPPSRIEIGFLRFRFAKSSHYTFYNHSHILRGMLKNLRNQKPTIQFVKFSPNYFRESYT